MQPKALLRPGMPEMSRSPPPPPPVTPPKEGRMWGEMVFLQLCEQPSSPDSEAQKVLHVAVNTDLMGQVGGGRNF